MNDELVQLYRELLLMIDNIKESGIDVSKYSEKMSAIDVNEWVMNDSVQEKQLKELLKLKNELLRYDENVKLYNSCNWIKSDGSITAIINNDNLEKCVEEVIQDLAIINDEYPNETREGIIRDALNVAYDIVKAELLVGDESRVYNYILNNKKIYLPFLSMLVINDCSSNEKTNHDDEIKKMIYDARKSGINANCFDLELIKKIARRENEEWLKGRITSRVEKIILKFSSNSSQMKELRNKALGEFDYIERGNINCKENKKNIKNNIISLLLSISMLYGVGHLSFNIAKRESYEKTYNETSEVYSSLTDETNTYNKEVTTNNKRTKYEEKVFARKYNPGHDGYLYYDFSDNAISFDTLKEYYEYGVDNFGVEPSTNKLDEISKSIPEFTEIYRNTYELLSENTEISPDATVILAMVIFFEFVLYLMLEAFTNKKKNYGIIVTSIKNIIVQTKELIRNKADYLPNSNSLEEKFKLIVAKNIENKQLLSEFMKLYEELRNDVKDYSTAEKYMADIKANNIDSEKMIRDDIKEFLADNKIDDRKIRKLLNK